MDRNEVFKGNVLRKLYGSEKAASVSTETSSTVLPVLTTKQGQTSSTVLPVLTTTKRKIYGADGPPSNYQASDVEESLPSDTDPITTKRRRGDHVSQRSDANSPAHNVVQQDKKHELTKNQKRKLKKKRRKDKWIHDPHKKDVDKEFIYGEEEKESEKIVPGYFDKTSDESESVGCLVEFFEAIWEVYHLEGRMTEDLDYYKVKQESFSFAKLYLENIEDTKMNIELKYLANLKTLLVLNDRQRAKEAILQFMENTQMEKNVKEILSELMFYWINSIMSVA